VPNKNALLTKAVRCLTLAASPASTACSPTIACSGGGTAKTPYGAEKFVDSNVEKIGQRKKNHTKIQNLKIDRSIAIRKESGQENTTAR